LRGGVGEMDPFFLGDVGEDFAHLHEISVQGHLQ
jgi:hypothetical protein